MTRRMSCSMTVPAVRDHSKTVTRRHIDSWRSLAAGHQLTLIERGMGLPKGARQVVLAEVIVVDVRVESLGEVLYEFDPVTMRPAGTAREGLPEMVAAEFVPFWLAAHGYSVANLSWAQALQVPCRRIEWRYVSHVDHGGGS